jgi:hypothetical protein
LSKPAVGSAPPAIKPKPLPISSGAVAQIEKASGSYLLEFQSGKFYAGKGSEARMRQSIKRIESTYGDKIKSSTYHSASNAVEAFINEHSMMMQLGGPKSFNPMSPTYNMIFSPGKKLSQIKP